MALKPHHEQRDWWGSNPQESLRSSWGLGLTHFRVSSRIALGHTRFVERAR